MIFTASKMVPFRRWTVTLLLIYSVMSLDNVTSTSVDPETSANSTTAVTTEKSQNTEKFASTTKPVVTTTLLVTKQKQSTSLAPPVIATTIANRNESSSNKTGMFDGAVYPVPGHDEANFSMYVRAFAVVVGVGSLIVVYLMVKTIRGRRRKSNSRRYGVLDEQSMELHAVANDEDEEDLFDQSRRRLI